MTDKVVFITGPTASGKSSIALEVAKKIDGEVISCDSQQVYKEMDIGTNKIKKSQMDGINHHMIDFVDPRDEYSVQDFSRKSRDLIEKINLSGRIPIVTGGTGFYIDSILFDMNYGDTPKDKNIRKKYEKIKDEKGNQYLHSVLSSVDKKSADKYHYNETNRVIRALEIYELTGKLPSDLRKGKNKLNRKIDPILFFINYEDRSILYDKINTRVLLMFNEGLYNEFLYLLDEYGLDKKSQSMRAIGYKELFNLYDNKLTKKDTIKLIQRNTRRYAKRQVTWMRKYLDYDFTSYKNRDKIKKIDLINEIEREIREKYDIWWIF